MNGVWFVATGPAQMKGPNAAVMGILTILGQYVLQPPSAACALTFQHGAVRTAKPALKPAVCASKGKGWWHAHARAIPFSLCANMKGAAQDIVEANAGHEIRRASIRVAGLGRPFLRSRDVLQLLYETRQEQFEELILQPLDEVTKQIMPMQAQLADAKKRYDETENEIFGSQIRPLEVKMKPLLEQQAVLEKDKSRGDKTMAAILEALERSKERLATNGVHDVVLAGFDKTIKVQAGRKVGMSEDSEISWQISGKGDALSIGGKWKPNSQFPEQPMVVDVHGLSPDFSGLRRQAVVLSFAPPDEGVKKLCAVAEWKGAITAEDVTARLEQLMIKCYMDGLIPQKDQGLGPVAFLHAHALAQVLQIVFAVHAGLRALKMIVPESPDALF